MVTLHTEEPLAAALVEVIHTGDASALKRLLAENPGLSTARLGDDDPKGMSRTLLHVATDWPGALPQGCSDRGGARRGGSRHQCAFPWTTPRDTASLGGEQR